MVRGGSRPLVRRLIVARRQIAVEPFPFQTSDVSVSFRFRSGIQSRARKRYYAARVTGDDGLRKAIGGDRRTESLNWFAPLGECRE